MTKPKKKTATKKPVKKAGPKAGTDLIPQPHGGRIWQGAPANPVAGPGRPPDAIRAQMRELGAAKGIPFLEDVLDGRIRFTLVGQCSECGEESKPAASDWLKGLTDQIRASVDQRLKANEQAFKYGMGTKDEISVVHPDVVDRLERQVALIMGRPVWNRDELLALLSEVWS